MSNFIKMSVGKCYEQFNVCVNVVFSRFVIHVVSFMSSLWSLMWHGFSANASQLLFTDLRLQTGV